MSDKPVLFDIEDDAAPDVAAAPPVPEAAGLPEPAAMQQAVRIAARRPSRLARWFWGLAAGLAGAAASVAAWDFATGLIARVPLLGWAVSAGLVAALVLALLLMLRELASLARLSRVDGLRRAAEEAGTDLAAAGKFSQRLAAFYRGRAELSWHLARLQERRAEVMDADAVLDLTEAELLAPLDQAALREVEAAARQVATALVPLALADVAAALFTSLRMIRRVAEIYGGRSGLFSSWRLMRAVFGHLAATGAVAVADDLLEPVLGGSVLSKLSRRFGEGLVNGALTARVGIAAMEVCRPMPYSAGRKPNVRGVVKRALTGVFSKDT